LHGDRFIPNASIEKYFRGAIVLMGAIATGMAVASFSKASIEGYFRGAIGLMGAIATFLTTEL